ncbi:MAG: fibronectin type III domain-containing protein, partial [Armatimonadota bacterium]
MRRYVPGFIFLSLVCSFCVSAARAAWTPLVNVSAGMEQLRGLGSTPQLWDNWQSFVLDSNGKVHVCWVDWNDNEEKWLMYSNNVSGAFSTPQRISVSGYYFYAAGTCLAITSDDTLHLIVTAKNNGVNNQGVLYLTKSPAGAWSAPTPLTPFDGSRFSYADSIVAMPDNSLFMCAMDSIGRKEFGRFKSAGGAWGADEILAESGYDFPRCSARAIGDDLYFSFSHKNDGAYYKVYRAGVWGSFTKLASFGQIGSGLRLSKSPITGELAALYGYQPDNGLDLDFNLYARFSSDGGSTWGAEQRISPGDYLDRGGDGRYDLAGNYHVIWESIPYNGAQGDILYKMRTPAGVWGSIENRTNSIGRTGSAVDPLQITGQTVHLLVADSGNDTGVPGYEDVRYTHSIPPVDTTAPAPVTGFGASPGEERVTLNWTNSISPDVSGVMIRMSYSAYPATPYSGTYVTAQYGQSGSLGSKLVIPVSPGVPTYFSAFAIDQSGNVSPVATVAATAIVDVTPPGNPTAVTLNADAAYNATLTWANPNDADFKGTIIRYKTTGYPTGPNDGFLAANVMTKPPATTIIVPSLAPGYTYYFKLFSYDAKPNFSSGTPISISLLANSCGSVKQTASGSVALSGKIVTALLTSDAAIYVQEPDRSSGIRVQGSVAGLNLVRGDVVNISGTMATRVISGYPAERQITGTITRAGQPVQTVKPLKLTSRTIGGQTVGLVSGVKDAVGLNNMG